MTDSPKPDHGVVEWMKEQIAHLLGGASGGKEAMASKASFSTIKEAWWRGELGAPLGKKPLVWEALRYGVAAAGVMFALTLQCGLSDWVGGKLPTFVLFYPAVTVAALLGGWGPGLLATGLTMVVVDFWLMPPAGFTIGSPVDQLALALFAFNGSLITLVTEFYRRSRERAAAHDREQAVRDTQARLVRLYESPLMGVIFWNLDGQITDANNKFLEMTGYTREDLIAGRIDWAAMTPSEFRHLDEASVKELKVTGVNAAPFEKEYLRKDGTRLPVLVAGAMLDEARFNGVAFVLDIAERKQTEAKMRESEEVFRAIFDQSMVGKVQADLATGRFLRVNPAFCQFTGYSEKELLERTFLEITHPDDRAGDAAKLQALREGRKESFESEKRYVRLDGGIVWGYVSVNLVHDLAGRGKFAVAVVQDITASKEAKEKLAQLTQLLSESQKIAHLGSFEYVAETHSTIWSEEEYCIYGLDPKGPSPTYEVMLAKSIHPEDAALLHETFAEAMHTGGIYELEHRIVRPDGSMRWVYDRANPYFDEQGKLLRYVGATLDITERKQAEADLQASLREKDVLLHEVHHRVKNNLQVISSLVSLQTGSIAGPEREVFENIQDQVRAMALVHEKLYQAGDFGRIEFAEYTRNLLGQLWRAHGEIASRANLALDLQPVTMPLTMAVPCGLVLNELAGNALKHAFRSRPQGGQVKISLTSNPESRVCLRVSDNGAGLPHGLDWRNTQSLGLRLVQMLVRQLGGTVDARCSDGGGAEFEVQFSAKGEGANEQ